MYASPTKAVHSSTNQNAVHGKGKGGKKHFKVLLSPCEWGNYECIMFMAHGGCRIQIRCTLITDEQKLLKIASEL